jgi:hypothetical protein
MDVLFDHFASAKFSLSRGRAQPGANSNQASLLRHAPHPVKVLGAGHPVGENQVDILRCLASPTWRLLTVIYNRERRNAARRNQKQAS